MDRTEYRTQAYGTIDLQYIPGCSAATGAAAAFVAYVVAGAWTYWDETAYPVHHDDAAADAVDAVVADADAWNKTWEAWACSFPKDYCSHYHYHYHYYYLHLVLLMMEAEEEDPETEHWDVAYGEGDAAYDDAGDVACGAVVAAEGFVLVVPSGWRSEAKGVAVAAAVGGSESDAVDGRVDSVLDNAYLELQLALW
jgi:hypothetical protein